MDATLSRYQPIALSLFRFITGLLLFQYGVAKILGFPVVPMFAKLPPLILAAGTIELVLGGLLMIGLFTRIVAFILSGEMACAYFLGHMFKNPEQPQFFPLLNGGELAIVYCFVFLYIWFAGGGQWSLDRVRTRPPYPIGTSARRRSGPPFRPDAIDRSAEDAAALAVARSPVRTSAPSCGSSRRRCRARARQPANPDTDRCEKGTPEPRPRLSR